ncbi:MAG: serine protein kinase PrkA [Deltaproteobacteria bacterium]|nr:serine protein kinase PrkA [Deltaproteobacteria bacterium]
MDETLPLRDIESRLARDYRERKHVLSFDELFAAFLSEPRRHLRTAPQYLRDCMSHYGTREVERPGGRYLRFNLFDCPWSNGKDRVVGQEEAQNAIFRLLQNFVRERRVTRLVLLHGPNGSAKSSLIECLGQALEHYSTLDEGAIYRFNWVFPSTRVSKKRLGFSGLGDGPERTSALQSYAFLEDEDVDARLPADLRDHPLLLLPARDRKALFQRLVEDGRLPRARGDEPIGEYFLEGDLSPRSRAIVDALLNAYQGDFQRVLQHVQVVRFGFSRRYRQGVVTIEPQLHVDAGMRQVTMDQGLHALPPSLRNLSLYEPYGDLVDANRGIVNYNDLLKKPIDAFKYLLATCERGTVALPNAILHLDVVFLASSNETHLRAFKEYPDFASFKGRMDLVRMPYLRTWTTERVIYDEHLAAGGLDDQVVPHATFVLALWAVLTRLKRPRPELYPARIRDVVAKLTPMEKAELYANGRAPRELNPEQTRELVAILPELLGEGQDAPDSEGLFGASPREMKQVLLNALQNKRHWGLSPLGIIEELRELARMKSVYEYLQAKRDGGYHDHEGFIDQVFDRWLDLVDSELRHAMGMVDEQRYEDLFARYLLNVTYLQKNEKLYNERTGNYDPPDGKLIAELERVWEPSGDAERFRRDLVSRVGAFRIENKGEPIPYRKLFPKLIEALEQDYYAKQKARVRRQLEHCMTALAAAAMGEEPPTIQGVSPADIVKAREVLDRLHVDHRYPRGALRETLAALLKHRY